MKEAIHKVIGRSTSEGGLSFDKMSLPENLSVTVDLAPLVSAVISISSRLEVISSTLIQLVEANKREIVFPDFPTPVVNVTVPETKIDVHVPQHNIAIPKFPDFPTPIVNITVPEAKIEVNVPQAKNEINVPAPVVNVSVPERKIDVHVPEMKYDIHVPESKALAPRNEINLPAPIVNVQVPESKIDLHVPESKYDVYVPIYIPEPIVNVHVPEAVINVHVPESKIQVLGTTGESQPIILEDKSRNVGYLIGAILIAPAISEVIRYIINLFH